MIMPPMYKADSISGDMKQKDVLAVIDQFARNEIQILVSTTIVEVGVNVPNATAIAVMNADRFGLAALHQLRGRVGRKGDQGYCCLVSDTSNEKLAAMTMFPSGFKIAEVDLQLRGPGDILGSEQTGRLQGRGYDPPLPEVGGGHPQLFSNKGVTWYDKTGNYDRLCRLFGNSAGRQGP